MIISDSKRLSYHFINKSDSEFLYLLDNNPEVMRYLNGGIPTSRQDIEKVFIPRLYAYRNEDKGWGLWKVTIIDSQEDIGWILVRPMDFFSDTPDFNNIELGWRFLQSSWGKGYATEAAIHIKDALSALPENEFFSATALVKNTGSIQVMKNISMEYVKTYTYSDSSFSEESAVLYQVKNGALSEV